MKYTAKDIATLLTNNNTSGKKYTEKDVTSKMLADFQKGMDVINKTQPDYDIHKDDYDGPQDDDFMEMFLKVATDAGVDLFEKKAELESKLDGDQGTTTNGGFQGNGKTNEAVVDNKLKNAISKRFTDETRGANLSISLMDDGSGGLSAYFVDAKTGKDPVNPSKDAKRILDKIMADYGFKGGDSKDGKYMAYVGESKTNESYNAQNMADILHIYGGNKVSMDAKNTDAKVLKSFNDMVDKFKKEYPKFDPDKVQNDSNADAMFATSIEDFISANKLNEAKSNLSTDILDKKWGEVYRGEDFMKERPEIVERMVDEYNDSFTSADLEKEWLDVYGEKLPKEFKEFYKKLNENMKVNEDLSNYKTIASDLIGNFGAKAKPEDITKNVADYAISGDNRKLADIIKSLGLKDTDKNGIAAFIKNHEMNEAKDSDKVTVGDTWVDSDGIKYKIKSVAGHNVTYCDEKGKDYALSYNDFINNHKINEAKKLNEAFVGDKVKTPSGKDGHIMSITKDITYVMNDEGKTEEMPTGSVTVTEATDYEGDKLPHRLPMFEDFKAARARKANKINESGDAEDANEALSDDEQSVIADFTSLTKGDYSKQDAYDEIIGSYDEQSLTPNVMKELKKLAGIK